MDIREIARRAKVSTATVSRAINRVPTVDPQLAKRVWRVVDELGYYPNIQARALVSGRSRIFGLIVSEFTNPFFPEIVQTFENLAVENNYEILITSTVNDPKRMELSVRRMIERRVDGVAILTFGMEEGLLEHLRYRKVPLVFVDVGPDVRGVANIRINYQNGIRQAVQHLAALRHTRIAFVAGPPHLKSAMARRETASSARPAPAHRFCCGPAALEVRHGQARGLQDVHDGDRTSSRLDHSRRSPHGGRDECPDCAQTFTKIGSA